ncbi:MAG: hypothetical protein ACI837_003192 [Crocinitomicaceae bacterium]|jgi:hypothetical protein
MRKLTTAFFLVGAIFLLFGSIGINVFFHSCNEDGLFISYFIEGEDHCASKHTEIKSCCSEEVTKETNDDCCDDEIKNYKINLDYFRNAVSGQLFNAEFQDSSSETKEILSLPHFTVANYANPPPQSRKQRITQLQVWII